MLSTIYKMKITQFRLFTINCYIFLYILCILTFIKNHNRNMNFKKTRILYIIIFCFVFLKQLIFFFLVYLNINDIGIIFFFQFLIFLLSKLQ